MLFFYPVIDGREGVRRRGQRRTVHAKGVKLHAAVAGIQTLLNGSVAKEIENEFRKHLVIMLVLEVIPLGNRVHG